MTIIKELAKKAMVLKKNVPVTGADGWTSLESMHLLDPEKFAELIVRECQTRVEKYIRDCGEIGSLPDTVIMKPFGIKE